MCNRYVDGFGTWAPEGPTIYSKNAADIVEHGYSMATEAATALVQDLTLIQHFSAFGELHLKVELHPHR